MLWNRYFVWHPAHCLITILFLTASQINLFFKFNQDETSFLSVLLHQKLWKLFFWWTFLSWNNMENCTVWGMLNLHTFFHTMLPPSNHIFSPGSCPVQPQTCTVGDRVSLGLLGVKCSFKPTIHYSWQKSLGVDTQWWKHLEDPHHPQLLSTQRGAKKKYTHRQGFFGSAEEEWITNPHILPPHRRQAIFTFLV